MSFQSLDFIFFFTAVSVLLFCVRGRIQSYVLLAANIFFISYGSISGMPVYVLVILLSYALGFLIYKYRKKSLIVLCVIALLCPLLFYKYIPFLMENLFQVASDSYIVNIGVPLGISFYTFHAISYVADIWLNKLKPEKNIVNYALFMSFFPYFTAGPISEPDKMLQQLKKPIAFSSENVSKCLRMYLYGMFLKLFVADRIAVIVNRAYTNPAGSSGVFLILATFLFGIQLYCDFNGYSIMAKGTAEIYGIDLIDNFNTPYFSLSVSDFWRRWHISLTTWFKKYVYIPLGGNRKSKARTLLNLMITFVLSGIWHGSNWTYAIWGALNGIYLCGERLLGVKSDAKNKTVRFFKWLLTYILINFAWIFFRANTLSDAATVITKIAYAPAEILNILKGSGSLSAIMPANGSFFWSLALSLAGIAILIILSILQKKGKPGYQRIADYPVAVRWVIYVLFIFAVLAFGQFGTSGDFIYFRF